MFWYYHCIRVTTNEVTSAAEPFEKQLDMSEGEKEYSMNTTKIIFMPVAQVPDFYSEREEASEKDYEN